MQLRKKILSLFPTIAAAAFAVILEFKPNVLGQYQQPVFWIAIAVFVVFGAITLFSSNKVSEEKNKMTDEEATEIKMGDNYTNFGVNNGHIGPVTFGKQEFQLTEAIMNEILRLPRDAPIYVEWIGSQRSAQTAHMIADRMRAEGFVISKIIGIGMRVPPAEAPISFSGNTLTVDVSK